MVKRIAAVLFFLAALLGAAAPSPREQFGFTPGDDSKLADYSQIVSYFEKLQKASDRLRLVRFGTSSEGRPLYVAFISSAQNLRRLKQYREISRKLALGAATEPEARKLAAQGKAIVWIDSGLHADELAPAQHAPELAYRMVSDDSEEMRRIRDNVILLQAPVTNPDGLEAVVEWRRSNAGTPYALAPLPRLYQKYAGHDNNRDWFMLNLPETREVTRLLFREWFPQIVYNQHESLNAAARMFVPPYAEPLNPNIPTAVMDGIDEIGMAIRERLAREGKAGVLSYEGYDAWWDGSLRSTPAFHNMHGILTETSHSRYPTSRTYRTEDLPERFPGGISTREPSVFYEHPWLGGKWGMRDSIEYMLTADAAILDFAATRREQLLRKAWDMARSQIEAGGKGQPYAYIVSPQQWDPAAAVEMLRRLQWGGIVVSRAEAPFVAGGRRYPALTYVLPAAQPFRGYLMDLMEPQRYPHLPVAKIPYDITGWTLRMSMGVRVDRIDAPFEAELTETAELAAPEPTLDHRSDESFVAVAELLKHGEGVAWTADGSIVRESADGMGFAQAPWKLHLPRVALYVPWTANSDTGWTQWLLNTFAVPYTVVNNDAVRQGRLHEKFDAVILASQRAASILEGSPPGEATGNRAGTLREEPGPAPLQRPEFQGGIGTAGVTALDEFVQEGGTLIALDEAAEAPVEWFPLALRPLLRRGGAYACPGSLIRIEVDNTHPIGFGMPAEAFAFSSGGQAWDVRFHRRYGGIRTVARYASSDLLASGWISGADAVLGKPILLDVRHGRGHVVLFEFRPQFRGQMYGTFKLLLNAIYLASATH